MPNMTISFKLPSDDESFLASVTIGYVLAPIASKVSEGQTEGVVKDLNGNTIGDWKITDG